MQAFARPKKGLKKRKMSTSSSSAGQLSSNVTGPLKKDLSLANEYLPLGLKADRQLTGPENYQEWKSDMLFLFRIHGVLPIMKDAVDDKSRAIRVIRQGSHPGTVVLSGADSATSARLDIWDTSKDMALLLRANELINASITVNPRRVLAGIINVHEKWDTLRAWAETTVNPNTKDEDIREELIIEEYEDIHDYFIQFMGKRAKMVAQGVQLDDQKCMEIFVDNCGRYDLPQEEKKRLSSLEKNPECQEANGCSSLSLTFAALKGLLGEEKKDPEYYQR